MKRHYAITFLPDADTASVCAQVSAQFRSSAVDPDFALGRDRNIPHLSLFHLMLDEAGAVVCKERLREIVDMRARLPVEGPEHLERFEIKGGVLFWIAEPTANLLGWHRMVLARCEPLRKGVVRPAYRLKGRKNLDAWQRTGYVFAGANYRPRITLQRLRTRADKKIPSTGIENWTWRPNQLVLAEVDDRGVITSRDAIAAEIALP